MIFAGERQDESKQEHKQAQIALGEGLLDLWPARLLACRTALLLLLMFHFFGAVVEANLLVHKELVTMIRTMGHV